jgi:hypothetical protein
VTVSLGARTLHDRYADDPAAGSETAEVAVTERKLPEHRGYVGTAWYSGDDRVFHGRVAGVRDVIWLEGDGVDARERAFRERVDMYLESCRRQARAPGRRTRGAKT